MLQNRVYFSYISWTNSKKPRGRSIHIRAQRLCTLFEKLMYHELAKDANFSNDASFTEFLAIRSVSDSEVYILFKQDKKTVKKRKRVLALFFASGSPLI
jgi:hypothetical protein